LDGIGRRIGASLTLSLFSIWNIKPPEQRLIMKSKKTFFRISMTKMDTGLGYVFVCSLAITCVGRALSVCWHLGRFYQISEENSSTTGYSFTSHQVGFSIGFRY